MTIEYKTTWHDAKYPPKDYCAYLCILKMNDHEGSHWQQVMHYDIKNKVWCENDPSSCVKGEEKPITNWWLVLSYKPLEWPENLYGI